MTARVALPSRRSLATGLPRTLFAGGEVEHVIDDLEGEAEVAAVFAKLLFERIADIWRAPLQLHGDVEEAGGLADR